MAIQAVDLTVPGGDTPRSANTKINANFTNTGHAASRLVGTGVGNVPEITGDGVAGLGLGGRPKLLSNLNIESINWVSGFYRAEGCTGIPTEPVSQIWNIRAIAHNHNANGFVHLIATSVLVRGEIFIRWKLDGNWQPWLKMYHAGNTTKEAETGYLVASSPVLKVQHNSFEKVHEAEQLDIDVQHVATGVYEITGTTGLRDDDGWYLKPPKDINGNVLCICEATQDGDVVTLKTYKKKFDFETVSIVADYEQPTDIPDGAEVMLRFNDLPDEPMPQGV